MPELGTLDVASRLDAAPEMPDLHTDPLTLPRVEILHLLYEIQSGPMLELLPPALHPTVPPTVTFVVWKAQGTDLGDFTMAQVRIGSRAGVRPRGYLLSSVIDGDGAAKDLGARWGFSSAPGSAVLRVSHHQVTATVERDGRAILDVALTTPEAISGNDIQYVANMNLARTPSGPRLVQVDPDYVFHKAMRGRPDIRAFDAGAWGDDRIVPVWPVHASYTVADVTLPKLRYVSRPEVSAMMGTEPVR